MQDTPFNFLFTASSSPYPTVSNDYLLQFLRAGNRLPPPLGCNKAIYAIMSR